MASFTEENYLKVIYKLSSETDSEISTNAVAEQTQTKAASVSDMLRKLSEKKLVSYQKYQGVRLTAEGEKVALKVIRKHRLWEVFLVDKLGFNWDEVHDIAEELEHIDSEKLVAKLDEYLGFPSFDPHGDPIPDHHGVMPAQTYQTLAEIKKGDKVIMMGVSEHSTAFLQYLAKINLVLGTTIQVVDVNTFDKSLQIELFNDTTIFITREVSKNILVKIQ
ncbi:MAG: metal-dependent transcriptional regulator [Spirosomataceae bacterium]